MFWCFCFTNYAYLWLSVGARLHRHDASVVTVCLSVPTPDRQTAADTDGMRTLTHLSCPSMLLSQRTQQENMDTMDYLLTVTESGLEQT